MEETTNSAHFLIFGHFVNECHYPYRLLDTGLSSSATLKTLEEKHSELFRDSKLSAVDSLILLEEEMRGKHHLQPKDFDHNILKKRIEEFNSLINQYNQIIKNPDSLERKENQKNLLDNIINLSRERKNGIAFPAVLYFM